MGDQPVTKVELDGIIVAFTTTINALTAQVVMPSTQKNNNTNNNVNNNANSNNRNNKNSGG